MAKTKGPLLSLDAHGSLSKLLTYSNKRTGQQVRKYNKPAGIPSAKQRGQRRLTEFLVAQWQNMTTGQRATWETNAKASAKNLPGYQYFLSKAQKDLYTHHGLAGYWHCNEIVGGQILDLSGKANHGTLEPAYPANAPVLVNSEKTKFGKALLYDGVDEYVTMGNPASLQITGPLTVVVILKVISHANWDVLIGKRQVAPNLGWNLLYDDANKLHFALSSDGTVEKKSGRMELTHNIWYHVIAVYDETSVELYIAGNKQGSGDAYSGSINNSPGDFIVGATSAAGAYSNIIPDEICVYNRGFSPAEVATRHKFYLQEAS